MIIRFTFDNKNVFQSIITKNTTDEINKCIWTLFHILNAKQITLIEEDDTDGR